MQKPPPLVSSQPAWDFLSGLWVFLFNVGAVVASKAKRVGAMATGADGGGGGSVRGDPSRIRQVVYIDVGDADDDAGDDDDV